MGKAKPEIGPPFSKDFSLYKVFDNCRAVMWIDDLVSLFEHNTPSGPRVDRWVETEDSTTFFLPAT